MANPSAYLFYDDNSKNPQRTAIGDRPLTVGSNEPCGLVLVRPGIAPIHAAIEQGPSGCRLRRLSRVRPVLVNGDDVKSGALSTGDVLTLGNTELRYAAAPEVADSMLRFVLAREDEEIRIDLPVAGSVTMIGRVEGDILIDDDSVSSSHLEVENFGDGMRWVRDLGSTNGSMLNGQPLIVGRREPLADGDVLKVGRVTIEVSEAGAPSPDLISVIQRTVIFVPDSAKA